MSHKQVAVQQINHDQFPRWYVTRADGCFWTGNGWTLCRNESLLMHDPAIATATCEMLTEQRIFSGQGFVTLHRKVIVEPLELIEYLRHNSEFILKNDGGKHACDQIQIDAGIDWDTLKEIT